MGEEGGSAGDDDGLGGKLGVEAGVRADLETRR